MARSALKRLSEIVTRSSQTLGVEPVLRNTFCQDAQNRFRFGVSLLAAACVSLGWLSTGRCEATNQAGNAVTVERCQSLRELTRWRYSSSQTEIEFQFKAHLIYTGPGWEHLRVQYKDKSYSFPANRSITGRLSKIRVGTLLSFYGRGYRDENGQAVFVVDRFENNLVAPYLKPRPGRLGPGMKGTPLFRFGVAGGTIREILKTKNRTFVLASNERTEFEVIQAGSNRKLGVDDVGEPWWFNGYVRKSHSTNPQRTLHQIDQMQESQMFRQANRDASLSDRPPQPNDGVLEEGPTISNSLYEGVVAFSDGERNLGVINGTQRFRIRTAFAHQLKAGMVLSGMGKPAANDRLDLPTYDAKFTEVHSRQIASLPIPVRINRRADLTDMRPLPPRVQVTATVKHCIFHDSTVDLHLQMADDVVVARIPIGNGNPALPYANLAEGTRVECSGMPMRHALDAVDPNFPGRSLWRIYVASSEDVIVLDRPVSLSTDRLFAGGLVLAFALSCGGFWIKRLRRQVKDGDRSLTEIDSHFRSAFGAMQCGILIVDKDSRILRSNNRLAPFFGVEPTVKSRLGQYIGFMDDSIESPSSMSDLIEASLRSPDRGFSVEVAMSDLKRTMRVFTCPIEMAVHNEQTRLWLFEDVSDKRRLESELLQSQKMDAVGRLSGGIAHDFNNLLMVIQSSLGKIRESSLISDDTDDHAGLQSAELAVERASELTQQLLGFARRQRLEKKPTNAVSLLENVAVLASHMVKTPQTLIFEKQLENIMLQVDPGRIEQALFNLCINAIDATKVEGGCVTLSIATCDDSNLGPCVRFSIVDNGPGIPSSDQQSIYDPFFTTKPVGQATGLGLSVALGVIEQHGGRIDCTSTCERSTQPPNTPQRGTQFDVFLPVISQERLLIEEINDQSHTDQPHTRKFSHTQEIPRDQKIAVAPEVTGAQEVPASQEVPAGRLPSGQSLSVLVVEDDPSVRVASCATLEQLGHRVTSVENAMLAIERLAYELTDLVLMDLVLPEMSGVEAYREIRSAWPDLPILFCSGHIDAANIIREGCHPDTPPLLPKPFTRSKLESQLDSFIDAKFGSADEAAIPAP